MSIFKIIFGLNIFYSFYLFIHVFIYTGIDTDIYLFRPIYLFIYSFISFLKNKRLKSHKNFGNFANLDFDYKY